MELKFDEGKHLYTVGKEKLESVTTFIGSFFKAFDEEAVATSLSDRTGKPVEEYYKEWEESRNHGTRVHNAIENYLKLTGKTELEPQDIAKYHEAIRILDLRPTNVTKESEYRLHSMKYKLAGTIDYLEIDQSKRTITIIDWKTNKSIHTTGYNGLMAMKPIDHLEDCSYNKYALQLSIYAKMLLEQLNVRLRKPYTIDKLLLAHLKPNGRKIYKVDYMEEEVEELLKRRLKDGTKKDIKKRSRSNSKKV